MSVATRIRPISRAEYERMVGLGLIGSDERVELIAGQIVRKMPQNPSHSAALTYASEAIRALFRSVVVFRVQMPLSLNGDSQPEPDVLVVRGQIADYALRHPEPDDCLLAIEVADTTLGDDRRNKISMYLQAGVPEVWLVDIPHRRVLRYTLADPDVPEVYGENGALPTEPPIPVIDLLP